MNCLGQEVGNERDGLGRERTWRGSGCCWFHPDPVYLLCMFVRNAIQTHWIRFCILAIFPGDSPAQGSLRSADLGSQYQSKPLHRMACVCPPQFQRHTARLCPSQVLICASRENTSGKLTWSLTRRIPERWQKHGTVESEYKHTKRVKWRTDSKYGPRQRRDFIRVYLKIGPWAAWYTVYSGTLTWSPTEGFHSRLVWGRKPCFSLLL